MNKVIWLNRGAFPTCFGFCPSEEAWNSELKKFGIDEADYPHSDARTSHFSGSKIGKRACIVTIGEHCDPKRRSDPIGFWALVAHEAVHVFQAIREHIGESAPSHEFEAYSIQHIFSELSDAYERTRGSNAKRILRKPRAGKPVSRRAGKRGMGRGGKQSGQRKASGSRKG